VELSDVSITGECDKVYGTDVYGVMAISAVAR